MKTYILLLNGSARIFRCEAPQRFSTPSLHRRINYSSQIQRAVFNRGRTLNLDYNPFDVLLRRFLCNVKTYIDDITEFRPEELQHFQEYLRNELDAVKKKRDQNRNRAIDKFGYTRLPVVYISGSEMKLSLEQLTKLDKVNIVDRLELSKFSKVLRKEFFVRIVPQSYEPSEEYHFILSHVKKDIPNFYDLIDFKIISPDNPFLPGALNNLRVGQEVEIRLITRGEKAYSHALEMLNNPVNWWIERSGFGTLLIFLKIRQAAQMPTPDDDKTDKFYDIDQKRAIAAALDDKRHFVVIHGPRGSGKTLVASEIITKFAIAGKRVFVTTYTIECLSELLNNCKMGGLNEKRMIVLTNNPSILRNSGEIFAKHPKQLEIDKLSAKYPVLSNQLRLAKAQNEVKRIKELQEEFANIKKQLKKLRDEIKGDVFSDISVIFKPSEKVTDDDLTYFRPNVQLIVNKNYYDKISTWKMLSQAPRTIWIGNPSVSECLGRHEFENRAEIQYPVAEFHNVESVCFPLSTRYETNAEIARCANQAVPYSYIDNIRIADAGAHKRVIDCLDQNHQEKFDRIQLGFPPNLFKQIIERPLVYIDKDMTSSKALFLRDLSLRPSHPATDMFYNLGDVLIMAKFAHALVRFGFPLDRIGFVFRRTLDAQPFVTRCLLKRELKLAKDEEFEKLAIGDEFRFQEQNLAPRDVIIRTGTQTSLQNVEKELGVPRLEFTLSSASLQHFMIASEEEHIRCKMPGSVIQKLQMIKEASLIISPDRIVTRRELEEANLFVQAQYNARNGKAKENFPNSISPKGNQFSSYREKRGTKRRFQQHEDILNLVDE